MEKLIISGEYQENINNVVDKLGITEKQLETVAEGFGLTVDEVLFADRNGRDLKAFDHYYGYFKWIHEDSSVEDLIELMWQREDLTNQDSIVALENGKIIFMYE